MTDTFFVPPFAAPSDAIVEAAMRAALEEAERAAALGEVPVGAVLLSGDTIVARAGNRRETTSDPLGHAELLVIQQASRSLGRWRLFGTSLVVTLEPCAMCAGAIVNSRIDHVVYGATDKKAGAAGSVVNLLAHPQLNHRPLVTPHVLADESANMLRAFFRARRRGPA